MSNPRREIGEAELSKILVVARARNAERNVTGMVLYLDGAFLQVLEVPSQAVQEIFDRIKDDKRHWDTQVLLDRNAPRAFREWSMGFERLRGEREGTFEAEASVLHAKIDPGALRDLPTLINTFYKINSGHYRGGLSRIWQFGPLNCAPPW